VVFLALRNVNVVEVGGTKLLVNMKRKFHFYFTELTFTRIGNDFVKYWYITNSFLKAATQFVHSAYN